MCCKRFSRGSWHLALLPFYAGKTPFERAVLWLVCKQGAFWGSRTLMSLKLSVTTVRPPVCPPNGVFPERSFSYDWTPYLQAQTANHNYLSPQICNATTWDNMALRRPPTRIDLKADDVEEYDKVRYYYYIYCVSGRAWCSEYAIYVTWKAKQTCAIQFIVGVATFIILTILYSLLNSFSSAILTSEYNTIIMWYTTPTWYYFIAQHQIIIYSCRGVITLDNEREKISSRTTNYNATNTTK